MQGRDAPVLQGNKQNGSLSPYALLTPFSDDLGSFTPGPSLPPIPSGSQALCCVSSAFIFLCPHTSHKAMGNFFYLSWLLEPGSSGLPRIRSSPWSCLGWLLLCQESRFVCWVFVATAGGHDPRGGVASSQHHPGGLDTSPPPPLFVPLAGAGQPGAARAREPG